MENGFPIGKIQRTKVSKSLCGQQSGALRKSDQNQTKHPMVNKHCFQNEINLFHFYTGVILECNIYVRLHMKSIKSQ